MAKKKKSDPSEEAMNKKRRGCISSAYRCLLEIKKHIQEVSNSKEEFIRDTLRYKACCSDIYDMLTALMESKVKTTISSGTLEKKYFGQVRGAFFKLGNQTSHQLNEIRDFNDRNPQNIWDYFLAKNGFVDQCESVIKIQVANDTELAKDIEVKFLNQIHMIQHPTEDTQKHYQQTLQQMQEILKLNTDRIISLCKLLPRTTKGDFIKVVNNIFDMNINDIEVLISNLLKSNILIETPSFYLIEDQKFAVQAVANFQENEDIRGIVYRLEQWEEANEQ